MQSSRQFITARFAELQFKSSLVPTYAADRLEAIVEPERRQLLAEYEAKNTELHARYEAKLRAFVTKKITHQSVGKAIAAGPPPVAPAAPSAPPALPHSSEGGVL